MKTLFVYLMLVSACFAGDPINWFAGTDPVESEELFTGTSILAQESIPFFGGCPNGQCPLPMRQVEVLPPPVVKMQPSGQSWTWPGDLSSHLETAHGVNTAGMSFSQKKSLHDALHNGAVSSATFQNFRTVQATTTTTYADRSYVYDTSWIREARRNVRLLDASTWFPVMRARRGW